MPKLTHMLALLGLRTCKALLAPFTVYTGCWSASGVSSVSGYLNSSHNGLGGPWLNATAASPPCTHGLPNSTALATPDNHSTSLGWNQTALTSRPTLTGGPGTTVQTADPIGVSSFLWSNSTSSSTTEQDSMSTLTLTLTSSVGVHMNLTLPSGRTTSCFIYGTTTDHPGNASTAVSMPTAYQSTLTYRSTTSGHSSPTRNYTRSMTRTTKRSSILPSTKSKTISSTPFVSGNTSTFNPAVPSPSSTPTTLPSVGTLNTTDTNDPLFTTTSHLGSSTRAVFNATSSTSAPGGWNTTTTPTSPSSTTGDGGSGDPYGGYTYSVPFSTSASGSEISVSSVDPVGANSTASISATLSSPARPSSFSTHTVSASSTDAAAETS
ncbi:hypothetical protein N658DRAFT_559884 [Parathielavia hyrcaniae]|uniref:Uncharacterized protein n=1 Tax=Parathielavia hyrcaniae TaxID=113614 RepID=A0AAN6PZW8_9PEZI|nr:hypothetical protein N658DRAFT_559884 [Parathielavia hyrcaniae]